MRASRSRRPMGHPGGILQRAPRLGRIHCEAVEELCAKSEPPVPLETVDVATSLAGRLLDPAISCEAGGLR